MPDRQDNYQAVYDILHGIYAKHRRKHRANPDSKQMCCMWSTDNPPDIIADTEPLLEIAEAFDISIEDAAAAEFYDMSLDEATDRIIEMQEQQKDGLS